MIVVQGMMKESYMIYSCKPRGSVQEVLPPPRIRNYRNFGAKTKGFDAL